MAAKNADLGTLSPDQLATLVGTAVAQGVLQVNGPKKMTAGQYARREAQRNPKPKLTVDITQNGYPVSADSAAVTPKAIEACNALRIGGRYVERRVEVVVSKDSNGRHVDLRYPNASNDHRMENARYWHSFEDLVTKIEAEQAVRLEKRKAKGWVEDEDNEDA